MGRRKRIAGNHGIAGGLVIQGDEVAAIRAGDGDAVVRQDFRGVGVGKAGRIEIQVLRLDIDEGAPGKGTGYQDLLVVIDRFGVVDVVRPGDFRLFRIGIPGPDEAGGVIAGITRHFLVEQVHFRPARGDELAPDTGRIGIIDRAGGEFHRGGDLRFDLLPVIGIEGHGNAARKVDGSHEEGDGPGPRTTVEGRRKRHGDGRGGRRIAPGAGIDRHLAGDLFAAVRLQDRLHDGIGPLLDGCPDHGRGRLRRNGVAGVAVTGKRRPADIREDEVGAVLVLRNPEGDLLPFDFHRGVRRTMGDEQVAGHRLVQGEDEERLGSTLVHRLPGIRSAAGHVNQLERIGRGKGERHGDAGRIPAGLDGNLHLGGCRFLLPVLVAGEGKQRCQHSQHP